MERYFRNKRFFFISSSSTTSTVTTTTVCYSATAGAGACTGRKRRAMIEDTLQPVPTRFLSNFQPRYFSTFYQLAIAMSICVFSLCSVVTLPEFQP